MTDPAPTPGLPQKPEPSRDARLKAALKSNMARRKAQARARSAASDNDIDNDNNRQEGAD